jgi:ABC-type transporter Mla subunit MlaD
MSAQPHYFRLGVFILLGLALALGAVLAFGGGQWFRPKVFCVTYVDSSVQGIDVGTQVKFRGVQIGKVRSLDFSYNLYGAAADADANQAGNYVVILMEIDHRVSPHMFDHQMKDPMERNIQEGLRVRIEPQGITGLNYLDFGFVDPQRFPPLEVPWESEYLYIPYAPGEITSALDSVNNIMRELEKLNIAGISKNTQELLENLNTAVVGARLGEVSDEVRRLISDLRTTVTEADIEDVSARIRTLTTDLSAAVEAANIEEVSNDARRLINDLRQSNRRLERNLANLESATSASSADLPEVLANAAEISENLRFVSEEIKRRPSLLLWGSPRKPTPTPAPTPLPKLPGKN